MEKTGTTVKIPIHEELAAELALHRPAHPAPSPGAT
jgi:hypothetical protein